MPYLTEKYGNPGSIHQMGTDAAKAVTAAREQVATFMGANDPSQIIFTSGGTEGNNLVFYGIYHELIFRSKYDIIISDIEHDSVHKAAERLRRGDYGMHGFLLTKILPDKDGIISVKNILHQSDPEHAGIISVMSANNELGTINPVYEICKLAHQNGALFHTDAVQASGMYDLQVWKNEYDFTTISSHKIHGPKGVGALYVKDPKTIDPLICGGAEQEFGLRGGTENVAGIIGFGKACELAGADCDLKKQNREKVNGFFIQTLIKTLGETDSFYVNGSPPLDFKSINLRFHGVDAETLVLMLSANGVCVSAGSACRAHESEPSRVLLSIGLTPEEARSSIRVSFSDFNTESEAEEAAIILARCVKTIQQLK